MNSVATVIVKPGGDPLVALDAVNAALAAAGCATGAPDRLGPEAVDLPFAGEVDAGLRHRVGDAGDAWHADVALQAAAGRRKKLLIADMDSTMIEVECIDELADLAGLGREVAAVTEAAMRGELDFSRALAERVALLRGLDLAVLERCLAERVRATPGARTLVGTMAAAGAATVLVSGGFTQFAEAVGKMLGFGRVEANRLGIVEGKLDGTVMQPVIDAAAKRSLLADEVARRKLDPLATLAIGDGANDIPMIEAAGLGISWRGKPKTEAAADVALRHADITAALYIQGFRSEAFVGD